MERAVRLAARAFAVALLFASCGTTFAQSGDAPMMTRWGKDVTADNAWREYPRPQMSREDWINLNGYWSYAINRRTGPRPAVMDGEILVPFPVESTLSGVARAVTPDDQIWYERQVELDAQQLEGRLLLHFGAVDFETSVWVNGGLVGSHRGGFNPFSFDIANFAKPGANTLTVRVVDPTSEGDQPRGKQRLEPFGIWYTPVSGIWQTVWLEPVPETYISEVRHTPNTDEKSLTVDILLNRESRPDDLVRITARDGGKVIARTQGLPNRRLKLQLRDPKLWSPDSPFLYDLDVELLRAKSPYPDLVVGDNGLINRNLERMTEKERRDYAAARARGPVRDKVRSYFAMRKSSIGEGTVAGQPALLLNDAPVFQNGVLDQGWWPDGLHTPPSDAAMIWELEFLKSAGFNMVRKHIKIEPARY